MICSSHPCFQCGSIDWCIIITNYLICDELKWQHTMKYIGLDMNTQNWAFVYIYGNKISFVPVPVCISPHFSTTQVEKNPFYNTLIITIAYIFLSPTAWCLHMTTSLKSLPHTHTHTRTSYTHTHHINITPAQTGTHTHEWWRWRWAEKIKLAVCVCVCVWRESGHHAFSIALETTLK